MNRENENDDIDVEETEPEPNYFELDPQSRFIKYIQLGRVEQALDLLEQGLIQVDVHDRKGFHMLHYGSIAGSLEILEAFFKADPKLKERINIADWTGCTPLHYTCNEGWEDCTEFLLKNGASTRTLTEDSVAYIGGTTMPVYASGGKTPLHLAADRGEIGCVKILLKYGAPIDIADNDGIFSLRYSKLSLQGNLAYHLALLRKSSDIAELLRPTPQHPLQLSQSEIDEKKLSDHRNRSQRITKKEKDKKERDRQAIISKYNALYPEILSFEDSMLATSFAEAIKIGTPEAILSTLKEETLGVFSFDMLTPEFCKKLVEEQENYEKSGLPVRRPNSMNNYGLILDDIGFQSMISEMIKKCVSPLAKYLFPDSGGASLDSHHAFIVRYKIGEDLDLSTHTDDSEVTLNVCLGKEFKGGTLYFNGVKNTETANKSHFEYTHTPGKAILHVGKHIHGANKITEGERINLIIWCRSSQIRGSKKRESRPADIVIPAEPGKHAATIIFLHGLGDTGDGWVLHMRKLRLKYPQLRFLLPTARNMPVTVNDGQISTAWHDTKGYKNIVDEKFEGLEDSKLMIEQIIEREVAQTGIPYERIFLAGFSQGAATALYTTYTFKKKLGGAVALSGYLPFSKEFDKRFSDANVKTPALIFHGLSDEIIKPEYGKEAHKTLETFGVHSTLVLLQDHTHRTNDSEFKKIEEFILEQIGNK